MSGGSLDYGFRQIEELADAIDAKAESPLHRAFADHLRLCAKGAYALEWYLSGDTSPGSEEAAICAVVSPAAGLRQALSEARQASEHLEAAVIRAQEAL